MSWGGASGQNVEQVRFYVQIYMDIDVCISLEGHNLGIFYTRKLKLGMLHTQT